MEIPFFIDAVVLFRLEPKMVAGPADGCFQSCRRRKPCCDAFGAIARPV
jgi:hypothetical protein